MSEIENRVTPDIFRLLVSCAIERPLSATSRMLDLNDLYYFVQTVEKKGISAAARALDVPKSTVSRHILALEAALGVRLIQRTTRTFVCPSSNGCPVSAHPGE